MAEQIILPNLTWEMTQTGSALAQLHQQDPKHLRTLTRSDEATTLLTLAADLTWLCPQQKHRIQTIAVRLATVLLNAPPLRLPIHGDFNAEQVLLSSEGISVIDFDRAGRGDPATDLGSFIAKLEQAELCGRLSTYQCEQLAATLIAGYRTVAGDSISNDWIQLYVAVGLFRLASEPFRYCEPDWLAKISAILDRIEQRLAQVPSDRLCSSYPA
ncbi:aminoglycoside phosphotransferase family protein [Leptolyngbya sp. NK1-12]|uniref:Aminoglycoside phosphotransferase family protein n=1 Tax=Leptolyngbya sp. NK1-12 TaxID=2547451 RepID=A0AA96WNJ6_9CYAN|nr:aminoglycoside phosphotransferase family protein [Leptolyngbya sp. NK1-12]WNZ25851.1 aminoglycoside phosphotransferase family protein [Leptolyngbya sp. NK1-12]